MSKPKNSSISKDFPLYHSDLIPIYESHKILPKGKRILKSNIYTNEHPDFFKLDFMFEKGYRNPYLDEVIKVDRSEELKKMENNKKRLELINFIKSNRKYSQDPNMLKYIRSEFDIEMYKKRQNLKNSINANSVNNISNINSNNNKNLYLTTEPNDKNYIRLIKKLNFFAPKAHYQNLKFRLKEKPKIQKYVISEENYEKLKNLKIDIDPQKSAYMTNFNDYKISEAQKRDINKELTFRRKDYNKIDIITGKNEKIKLPEERNERWSKFYENYFLMLTNKGGFRKKGGLFTEFTNKNIGSINVSKNELKEKMQKLKRYYSHDNKNNKY